MQAERADPPAKQPRNIVILLDGTGNQFSARNSNVIKLMSVLEADEKQLLFYSSGVGTILPEAADLWSRSKQKIATAIAEATAFNFETFVCDAYKFLMDYYQSGDRIFIFGFSRGSYTARALAGMVQKVGLLPPGNHNQIKLAYQVYKAPDAVQSKTMGEETLSRLYRRIFGISRPVSIHFIGAFDTVSSLGGLRLPRLAFAGGVKSVQFFRQALALDERRARFAPEYRVRDVDELDRMPSHGTEIMAQVASLLERSQRSPGDAGAQAALDKALQDNCRVVALVDGKVRRKNVECWFMGCHSDVGGGNDVNGEDSLSNISFRWMLREATQCGIRLDPVGVALQPALAKSPAVTGLIPEGLRELLEREVGGEALEVDDFDKLKALVEPLPPRVLSQIVDLAAAQDTTPVRDLDAKTDPAISEETISSDMKRQPKESLTWKWWIAEILWLQTRYQDPAGVERQIDKWQFGLGLPRQMAKGQFIHRSVLHRLRYDRPVDGQPVKDKGHDAYGNAAGEPQARLPGVWGTTWDDLRKGALSSIWED